MFRFLDYVGTTSTYNEFGRVIIRTSNGDMNGTLIEMALDGGINDDMLTTNEIISFPSPNKTLFFAGLHKCQKNVFLINKNRNGHYKFKVISENLSLPNILVLIDTKPREDDLNSVGILTPCKSTLEFVHNISQPKLDSLPGNTVIKPDNILYTFTTFKQLVKKFGIYNIENIGEQYVRLAAVANMNKYEENDHTQPEKRPGLLTKIRRGVNIGRRGFKQYVMNESASMSKTHPRSNTGPSVRSRFRNWLRPNQPNQPNSS